MKTFQYDDQLPSLPLPTLECTLERYLDSVRAIVSANEYENTKNIVEQFAKGLGKELHEELKNQIEQRRERNWLAKWWDEEIYLKYRLPIAPIVNMMGFNCLITGKADSQLERASIHMHACALVFQMIREERYPISHVAKRPQTMYQFKHFFNTCRIPRKDCDELVSYFRTVSEDVKSPPTHILIIRNGHLFIFDLYESNGLLSPPEIRQQLEEIIKRCDQNSGLGLGALTALPRNEWAELRERLCEMSEENKTNFRLIEEALLVYAFDNENAETLTDLARIGMLKNCQSRWFDRSNVFIITKNGLFATNGDHSAFEGTIPSQITDHIQNRVDALEKIVSWPKSMHQTPVRELLFTYDTSILISIQRATELFNSTSSNIDVLVIHNERFTKNDFKKYIHIHPDTFFQMCLQLAYFQIHGHKPAATYETASTRTFYRGRTETVRSCTPEVVRWCYSMINDNNQISMIEKRKLFLTAANRHQQLMTESSANQGCDRHLFGLSMIAYLTGKSFPLSNDPSWIKSGGSGNFILSTSCIGFSISVGGTAPMCPNGYGVFYRFGNDGITFVVTAYRNSIHNSVKLLAESIEHSLFQVKTLFINSNL